MDELSKRRKWRRWLELVEEEVQGLQREYQLYTELRQHLASHPEWVSWLDTLYLVGVSLAIRRLTEANPRHRTVSLVKLLKDLEAYSSYMSRQSALQGADALRRSEVHRLFDQVAGEGCMHVPQHVIRQWRGDLERQATPFRLWVDHRVAHHDLSADAAPPMRQQVEQVLLSLRSMLEILRVLLV